MVKNAYKPNGFNMSRYFKFAKNEKDWNELNIPKEKQIQDFYGRRSPMLQEEMPNDDETKINQIWQAFIEMISLMYPHYPPVN